MCPIFTDEGRPGTNLYTNRSFFWMHRLDACVVPQFIPHDVHDYDVTHVGPIFKTANQWVDAQRGRQHRKRRMLRLTDRDSKDILYSVRSPTDRTLKLLYTTPMPRLPGTLGDRSGRAPHISETEPTGSSCHRLVRGFKKRRHAAIRRKSIRTAFTSAVKQIRSVVSPHVDGSLGSTR